MNVRIAVICVTVLVLSLRAQGRPDVGRPSKDTLPAREKKTGRFSRLLYQTISVTPRDKEAEMRAAKADQEYFEQFAGKKIGDIRIVRENVFNPHSKVWGERKTNAMHRITQESKIRRDLFIKPGDRFDPLLVTNNRQLIRSRRRKHPRNPRDAGLVGRRPDRHDPRSLDDRHRPEFAKRREHLFRTLRRQHSGVGEQAERQDLFQLEKLELRRQPVRIREPEYPGQLRRRAHHRRQRIQLLRLRS